MTAYAQSLLDHLEKRPDEPLADLAYTLHVGRDAMRERLAVVATSTAELRQALARFVAGDPAPGVHRAAGGVDHPLRQALSGGDTAAVVVEHLVDRGDHERLAMCWVNGLDVDWRRLYRGQQRRRLSLPTYPFAGGRHWVPGPPRPPARPETPAPAWLRTVWRPAAAPDPAPAGDVLVVIGAVDLPDDGRRPLVITTTTGDPVAGLAALPPAAPRIDVLHAAALDDDGDDTADPLSTLVPLLTSLLGRPGLQALRLVYAHHAPEAVAAPRHAAVAALLRSVVQEDRRLSARTVEVTGPAEPAALLAELDRADAVEIRHDHGRRLVRRLVPDTATPEIRPGESAGVIRLRERGVYLITGGGGGIGGLLAGHLARAVHARLVLVGRSAVADPGQIADLVSAGAEVLYLSGDVSLPADVTRIVAAARERFGRLDGVIHAAGVLRDGFLRGRGPEDLAAVLAAKVTGTRLLDLATRDDGRDFLVLCSSIAGVVGNAGQAAYAYANAYLGHYAAHRHAHGDPTVRALHFPLWADGGMVVDRESMAEAFAASGVEPMPTADGIDALTRLLGVPRPEAVLGYGLPRLFGHLSRLFDDPAAPLPVAPPRVERPAEVPVERVEIAAPPPAATPDDRTEHLLRDVLGRLMKLPPDGFEPATPLVDYGMDSMVVRGLNEELAGIFGPLPSTLAYEYPTLAALTGHLATRLPAARAEPVVTRAEPVVTRAEPVVTRAEPVAARAELPARPSATRAVPPALGSATRDIAIIGLSGRYPGADDIDAFWQRLLAGDDCVTEIPAERWDADAFFDPDPERAVEGRSYSRWGAFLDGADRFDPLLFGISPREAELMDPQERLFLQTAWAAFESAGYPRRRLRSTARSVGVFAGVTTYTYLLWGPQEQARGNWVNPQTTPWSLANRVSYLMDLHGPSMPVDTACSSSLVGLHLACTSLRSGECDLALAGGVNLYLHPSRYATLSQARMLSRTGRCRSFGAGGDGFVPGEGVGAVVLKPLAAALRDRDHVYGVIKGTAVNHGGYTTGYTVPNPVAQAEVVARAQADGGVEPRTVTFLEAHGTGTGLGDPIEVAGLTTAFRQGTEDREFCALGSVKSNIGHLEAAAGIAGLTKVLLQMRHRTLVPTLHSDPVNPDLDLASTPFRLQRERADWPATGDDGTVPRRAGLSSFGAGGVNAHVVVEEFPAPAATPGTDGPQVVVLSARTGEQLRAYAERLAAHLGEPGEGPAAVAALVGEVLGVPADRLDPDEPLAEQGLDLVGRATLEGRLAAAGAGPWPADVTLRDLAGRTGAAPRLADLAYTLQVGREPMTERLALVVSGLAELRSRLDAYLAGDHGAAYRGSVGRERPEPGPVAAGDLDRLARLWTEGADVDFTALPGHGTARTVPLPTYPFAADRYWFPQPDLVPAASTPAEPPRRHPLLGADTSTPAATRFSTLLSGTEQVLRDHVIAGHPTLPGVAVLEMARAAAELAGHGPVTALRDVLWAQPVRVDDPLQVHLSLTPGGDGAQFELTGDGSDPVRYARGRIVAGGPPPAPPAPLDLAAIRAGLSGAMSGAECYRRLAAAGFGYGPAFRAMRELYGGADAALAHWELPDEADTTAAGPAGLHPAVLDSALHTAMGLHDSGPGTRPAAYVPFAVAEVVRYAPLPRRGWAYATLSGGSRLRKVDVLITDDEGRPSVRIAGLTLRELTGPAEPPVPGTGPLLFTTTWREAELPPDGPRHPAPRLLLIEPDAALRTVAAETGLPCTETAARGVYDELRRLAAARSDARLLIVQPGGGGLPGLARTARLEQPRLAVSTLETDATVTAAELSAEAHRGDDVEVRRHAGRRAVAGWREVPAPVAAEPLPVRADGAYLVTGGLGGLGRTMAEYLAGRGAGTVVVAGRSAPDPDALDWMAGLPGQVVYEAVDVTDPAAVTALAARFGAGHPPLRGVLHAAGVLRNGLLVTPGADDWTTVCAPKVTGVTVLDEATAQADLDWFVMFSSAAGAVGNPGQAAYAYANRFLDAYAIRRERLRERGERRGRSLSIGWGLWAEGGMGVDERTAAHLERAAGTLPLPTATGLAVFTAALATGLPYLGVLHGRQDRLRAGLELTAPAAASPVDRAGEVEAVLTGICAEVLKIPADQLDPEEELSAYGLDSILMMTVLTRIEQRYATAVEPSALAEYGTLRALAEHLRSTGVRGGQRPPAPEPGPVPAPMVDAAADPRIAIIGLAARLPGSPTVADFWANLRDGRDLVREFPPDRFDVAALYSADRTAEGRTYSRWGGFVDGDIFAFDAARFGIADDDALVMDPHHRLILELTEELLHDAGYRPEELAGTRTGVFIGGGESNYLKGRLDSLPGRLMRRAVVNTIPNMTAARVSDFFDLRGPSQTVDTACSSALVAVHQASQALRTGDCDLAVVGGVELITDGYLHIGFSKAEVLSPGGACRVFDEHADGIVPGEGGGLLLLKPYQAAVRDGDDIRAVLLGGAVNNDGRTMGLTVPSVDGQRDVLRRALDAAGVRAADISYLEAHGTGTLLGDPIEIRAATGVYEADGAVRQGCAVGSVKSNIGHLMRAAGAAALIKVVLALRHELIPPTLHCTRPHPRFRFAESPFFPVTRATPWPRENGRPRRAAISAFGFGGTNAHLVLAGHDGPAGSRRALPPPRYTRRHFRVGDPVPAVGSPANLDDILDRLQAGTLTPAVAAGLVGADGSHGRKDLAG